MSRWIERLQDVAQVVADRVCDLRTFPEGSGSIPPLVAHRGAWSADCPENSLRALQKAVDLGAWGIEFDVHFTKDGVPVVHHDLDLKRCHGVDGFLRDLTFSELRRLAPDVPSLDEVLTISAHRMIEIKIPMSPNQVRALAQSLARYSPVRDYHLLALDEKLVRPHSALPEAAWILVGDSRLGPLADLVETRKLGGVAGHYLFVRRALIERLHGGGFKAGSGFASSKNLHRREWSRGVDWVFTNHIADLV